MTFDESHSPQEIIIHEAPTAHQDDETSFGLIEHLNKEQQQARHWLMVTSAIVKDRISEYKSLGNKDALNDPNFLGAQKAFLTNARDKLLDGDPLYTGFLAKLEQEAQEQSIAGDLVTSKEAAQDHYILAHMNQVSFMAALVDEGQYRADNGLLDQASAPSGFANHS